MFFPVCEEERKERHPPAWTESPTCRRRGVCCFAESPMFSISHQALFSIYSLVAPQTGCWKRRKADRCCFSGFRVLGATSSTRFKYHRCFSTWAKMVKLQQETEPHYGQRHEIRDGVAWASQSCFLGLNKSVDWSHLLHQNLGFLSIFFIRELIKWHFIPIMMSPRGSFWLPNPLSRER